MDDPWKHLHALMEKNMADSCTWMVKNISKMQKEYKNSLFTIIITTTIIMIIIIIITVKFDVARRETAVELADRMT